jgi:hypothetical protein
MSDKAALIIKLGLSPELIDRGRASLQFAFKKYKAMLTAEQTYRAMVTNRTWDGNKLDRNDIIELFISRSYYHSHYRPYFQRASHSSLMVQWLEKEKPSDKPDDLTVWGEIKATYNFADLDKYLLAFEKKGKSKKGKEKEVNEKKEGSKKKKTEKSGSSKK